MFRLGLLLVVGAGLYSVMKFYISLGSSMASMQGEAPSTETKDLVRYFVHDFLFAGTGATALFWGGVVLMVARVALGFRRG